MKKCKRCGSDGPFCVSRASKDGLFHLCKMCQADLMRIRKATKIEFRALGIWSAMQQRVGNADGKHPAYSHVECRMTKAEFIAWYSLAVTEWMAKNPGTKPSVDRIDNTGHYEAGNLQVLSLRDNTRKSAKNKNVHAPDGTAWCAKCKMYLPLSQFHKMNRRPLPVQPRCRDCRSRVKDKCVASPLNGS